MRLKCIREKIERWSCFSNQIKIKCPKKVKFHSTINLILNIQHNLLTILKIPRKIVLLRKIRRFIRSIQKKEVRIVFKVKRSMITCCPKKIVSLILIKEVRLQSSPKKKSLPVLWGAVEEGHSWEVHQRPEKSDLLHLKFHFLEVLKWSISMRQNAEVNKVTNFQLQQYLELQ